MKLVVIFLTMLILGCGSSATNTNSTVATDSTYEAVTADSPENFDAFLEKFKNDSLFQIERVKFPWTLATWEPGTDAPTKQMIDRKDWKHLGFYYGASYATRQIDAYTQQVKNYGDTIKLELRGVDNGIMTDYEFIMENRKWFLVSAKDYSN